MSSKRTVLLGLVLVLILSACSSINGVDEPTATPIASINIDNGQLQTLAAKVGNFLQTPVPTLKLELDEKAEQTTPNPQLLIPGTGNQITATPVSGSTEGSESFEAVQVDQNLVALRNAGKYSDYVTALGKLQLSDLDMTQYLLRLSFERGNATEASLWPTTAQQAAIVFTGSAANTSRFQKNQYGGWHLIEGPILQVVVPANMIFEGYNDFGTPNRSPSQGGKAICWTSIDTNNSAWKVWTIGGTFWQPDTWNHMDLTQTATKILSEQVPFRQSGDKCVAVGFR
jgi:hypothetical protein